MIRKTVSHWKKLFSLIPVWDSRVGDQRKNVHRRLQIETLEDRHLLTAVGVTTLDASID